MDTNIIQIIGSAGFVAAIGVVIELVRRRPTAVDRSSATFSEMAKVAEAYRVAEHECSEELRKVREDVRLARGEIDDLRRQVAEMQQALASAKRTLADALSLFKET